VLGGEEKEGYTCMDPLGVKGKVYSWCKHQTNPHHQIRKRNDDEGQNGSKVSHLLFLYFASSLQVWVNRQPGRNADWFVSGLCQPKKTEMSHLLFLTLLQPSTCTYNFCCISN